MQRACPLAAGEQERWCRSFDQILERHLIDPAAARLANAAALLQMIDIAQRARSAPKPAPRADRRLAPALAMLERDLCRPLQVPLIAAAVGMSPDYFTRVFRRQLGAPPLQYLIGLRLAQARRMLAAEPQASVAVIAKACGFEDTGHFTRLFRSRFGLPPRAFRMSLDPG